MESNETEQHDQLVRVAENKQVKQVDFEHSVKPKRCLDQLISNYSCIRSIPKDLLSLFFPKEVRISSRVMLFQTAMKLQLHREQYKVSL